MEMVKFQNRLNISVSFILLFIAISCQTKEEKILDDAIVYFQRNQSDLGLEKIDFCGPVLKKRIENFKADTSTIVYGWYYVHEKDTFWMYSEVDKRLIKETSVSFSSNFWDLRDNHDLWETK